ncbi:MAG: hypothetical protein V3V45_00580 [Candidatus Brocadiales bacterium]
MVSIKEKGIPETGIKDQRSLRDNLFDFSSKIMGREGAKFHLLYLEGD